MSDDRPMSVLVKEPLAYEWHGETRTIPSGRFNASPFKLGPSLAELRTEFWMFDRLGDVGDAYAIDADTVTEWGQQGRIEFQP